MRDGGSDGMVMVVGVIDGGFASKCVEVDISDGHTPLGKSQRYEINPCVDIEPAKWPMVVDLRYHSPSTEIPAAGSEHLGVRIGEGSAELG